MKRFARFWWREADEGGANKVVPLEGSAAGPAAPERAQKHEEAESDAACPAHWGTAHFWVERRDLWWLRVGYGIIVVVTALVPFAITFGASSVLWAWWSVIVVVYCSFRAMRVTNNTLDASHASSLYALAVAALRYPLLWTFTAQYLGICVSVAQVGILLVETMRSPRDTTSVVFLWVLLLLVQDALTQTGFTGADTFAAVGFSISLIVLAAVFAWHHVPCLRAGVEACCRRLPMLRARPRSATARAISISLQRAHIACMFLLYLVLCPAVSNNLCSDDAWGAEWGGFVGLAVACLAMNVKLQRMPPPAPQRFVLRLRGSWYAFADDDVSVYIAALCLNIFLWSAVDCMDAGASVRIVLQLVHSLLVVVACLVAGGSRDYARHSKAEVVSTLVPRLPLIALALVAATIFVVGPVFSASSFYRSQSGCSMAVPRTVTTGGQYVQLELGAMPAALLNASLLVGLHNAYHQASPLASVVNSWGYSHPAIQAQLDLGYRGHTPIVVHIEPRGYKYSDLFCDRSDGAARMAQLQQQLFDVFSDRLYFPDELTDGYGSIYEALQQRGWPRVDALTGRVLFNLNVFSSNEACKQLYFAAEGASYDARLPYADSYAEEIGGSAVPTSASIALLSADVRSRKRKVLFNRGTVEEAQASLTTCMMEVTTTDYDNDPAIFGTGFITRFRIGKEPEPSSTILRVHDGMPATLISYDGVWP
eukprot:g7070.t1